MIRLSENTFTSTLPKVSFKCDNALLKNMKCTVKLGDKERFDKEQVGVKESFPMTNRQFTS